MSGKSVENHCSGKKIGKSLIVYKNVIRTIYRFAEFGGYVFCQNSWIFARYFP